MENTTITLSMHDVYFFLILLASLWGAIKIFKEIRQPSDELKKKVEDHDKWLKHDLDRFTRIEDCQDLLLECMYGIIDHQLTGNGVDEFKELKDKINRYLLKGGRSNND